jgi:hypothetical protein
MLSIISLRAQIGLGSRAAAPRKAAIAMNARAMRPPPIKDMIIARPRFWGRNIT